MSLMARLLFAGLMMPPCWIARGDAPAPPSGETLHALVERLGHEAFAEREAAQRELEALGERYPRFLITRLAEVYGRSRDVEIRFRMREVLRPLVTVHLVGRPSGFMGVHLEPVVLEDGAEAIVFSKVVEGKGADQAGLRRGDIVLSVENRPIQEVGGMEGFSNLVSEKPPGSLLEIVILRDGKSFRETVPLVMREGFQGWNDAPDRNIEVEVAEWFQRIGGEGDPDFPVGHFPGD